MTDVSYFPSNLRGLSDIEAHARLKAEGLNELPRPEQRTPLRIACDVLREPMLALLLGAGFVYLLLGDLKEALILLGFAMLSIVITIVQETRTSACSKRFATSQALARWSLVTASAGASPGARSRAATSSCSPKVIAFPRTVSCLRLMTCKSMSRY
jgi:magnesium-transporting ATPase (P-type)